MVRRSRFRQSTISGPTTGYRPPMTRAFIWARLPWPLIGSILAIAGVSWFIFGSSRFIVRSVVITGSVNDGVTQALESLKGKNILLLSTTGLERELPHQQSSIATLRIIKGFPDTLRINITVREPLIRWQSGDQEFYLDQSGVAFLLDPKPLASVTDQLPFVIDPRSQTIELGRALVPESFVRFAVALRRQFRDRSGIDLTGMSVSETTRELNVTTSNRLTIRFDTTRSLDPQLTTLAAIITTFGSSIRESIDLRVPGRVFYK